MIRFLFAAAAAPLVVAGCASSPELVDVMVLVGLLALRALSETVMRAKPRTPYAT